MLRLHRGQILMGAKRSILMMGEWSFGRQKQKGANWGSRNTCEENSMVGSWVWWHLC